MAHMRERSSGWRSGRRYLGRACIAALVFAAWYVASSQFSAGVLELVVFAPPAAVLGIATAWAAHVSMPDRFTWRRGLYGALIGGLVATPLVAAIIAFSAAWDPAVYVLVFGAGAWVALVGGALIGSTIDGVRWWRRRWRGSGPPAALDRDPSVQASVGPDEDRGIPPTLRRPVATYAVTRPPSHSSPENGRASTAAMSRAGGA